MTTESMQHAPSFESGYSQGYVRAMEHLVSVVQELSHLRTIDEIVTTVRTAARTLTGADGATFILREDDKCYYVDEDAISPWWKGQRFPMKNCISGWVMLNKAQAVIEDIYKDDRIPADAYRPTFVKSLAVVPIRRQQPIGAIGNYWAECRKPTDEELSILQALADVTSVALENAGLYGQLREKIDALEKSNHELSRFAWSASHDLKSPLRAIDSLSQWIEDDLADKLQGDAKKHMHILRARTHRMEKLLDDILEYSTLDTRANLHDTLSISGASMLENITELLDIPASFKVIASNDFKKLKIRARPLQQVLYNLIENAIKHHDKRTGTVAIDVKEEIGYFIFNVKDDGPGIEPRYHERIFEIFQTLKPRDAKEGSGMGLALVKKLLSLYKGNITLSSPKNRGCIFTFTLPKEVVLNS